jgi:hypothetical protein
MCNCTSGNLEIPGLVLAHHPGMTFFLNAIVSGDAGFSPHSASWM